MALLEPGELNIQDALKSSMVATDRAQRITQGLLNFSKRVRPYYEQVDVVEIIGEILQLVEREIEKQGIRLVKNFEPVPLMYGDIGQLQQVVLNIIINAKEAMPKGGAMTIGVSSSDTDIYIRISDTGEGIKQECMDKIFEPFFTTKDKSGGSLKIGTGLGLSVSLGIIRSYGGNITIETGSGGTTFTVSLPRGKTKKEEDSHGKKPKDSRC
jgi:signal transduction histidine kinase